MDATTMDCQKPIWVEISKSKIIIGKYLSAESDQGCQDA